MTRARVAALGAAVLLGSSLVTVGSPGAYAVTCDLTWAHSQGTVESWLDPTRWSPQGQPNGSDVVCLTTTDTVAIDAPFDIHTSGVQMDGATIVDVTEGAGLFADGAAESFWGQGTSVLVATAGSLGGHGTIRTQGKLTFKPGDLTALTTTPDGLGQQPPADPGELVVEGSATVDLGLGLQTGYHVTVGGGGTVTLAPTASLAADRGTALTVQAGGTLHLEGASDFQPGAAVSGQPAAQFTNNGLVLKSGGGTSVVDATYAGTGQVLVLGGTLALPDNQQVGAWVSPGTTFATGRCDAAGSACQPTTDPAKDAMSIAVTIPGANAGPATVQLHELGTVPAAVDPNAVGNEVLAHVDNLAAAGQPARIDLRYSQADVMATPLDQIQVVHTTDDGFDVVLPSCAGQTLPAGLDSCVVRPATRTADNTFVTVLTTTTSRWRVRRSAAVENQGAPTAPQGFKVDKAAPFDGSVLSVTWAPPASSGAGPLASYKVRFDGNVVANQAGTSLVLKNPGAGKHTVTVAGLNAAGEGVKASVTLTLPELSKPRKVGALQGSPGGKLSAGLSWLRPASAGGLRLTGYQVAIFKGTRKVDTDNVGASAAKKLYVLAPGRYTFRVRAKNADGFGPWSKPTDVVTPR